MRVYVSPLDIKLCHTPDSLPPFDVNSRYLKKLETINFQTFMFTADDDHSLITRPIIAVPFFTKCAADWTAGHGAT